MYPALAVLENLREDEMLWVGSIGGMEAELVERAGLRFEAIPAAGLHGVGLRTLPGNLLQMAHGFRYASHILRQFRPDALFFTGGYVAVPMAMAGRKVPSVLFVPDIEPGLAIKTIARFAGHVAVSADPSKAFFSGKSRVTVTGYPVRQQLQRWEPDTARQILGISADFPTLLVFGGSKGARSINRAVLAALPDLVAKIQIVHVSGMLDWPEVQEARATLPDKLGAHPEFASRYRAFQYLHDEMGAALAAADLVLSRAGASSLGEFPLFGLPAILVPYPHAWRYQQVNAEYLAENGAAMIISDDKLAGRLLPAVLELIQDKPKLEEMSRWMRTLYRPDAARQIAGLLRDAARMKVGMRIKT